MTPAQPGREEDCQRNSTRETRAPVRAHLRQDSLPREWTIAIISAAALALFCKLLLALKTYGTNDVYYHWQVPIWVQYVGVNIYPAIHFNQPPFVIHVLRLQEWLADATGLSFPFWWRVPNLMADAGSLWIVWRILEPRFRERSMRWSLLMFASAPTLILVSGFHGNTDPTMIFFLLLSVYLTEKGWSDWAAGAAFGLAMSIKVVPLIALPAILLYQANHRRRITFLAATAAVVLLAWSPFVFQDPKAVITTIFGYRSLYGIWGLSYLADQFGRAWPAGETLNEAFRLHGANLPFAAVAGLSLWMNRLRARPSLYDQVGLVFFAFLSLAPGFSVQYLAWLVPWAVGAGAIPAAVFYAASGAFLFLMYNHWSGGMPWYLADSNQVRDYPYDYSQLVCWLSVLVLLWVAWRQIAAGSAGKPAVWAWLPLQSRLPLAVSLALVMFALPFMRQVLASDNRASPRLLGASDVQAALRDQCVLLSDYLYGLHRPADAISAARQALAIDPNSAMAYNNIAAGYAALGVWDLAIENARRALRIQPDFALARNNLAWAEGQERTQRTEPGGK